MGPESDAGEAFRAELSRVVHSETFHNSESLRHLLSYLGEKSLTDPGGDLKEYTIGVEAFGKPSSYDPQRDASVRVQAGRLRQKLEEYYRTAGAADPLVLYLPKGRFTILSRARESEGGPLGSSRWARLASRVSRLARSARWWLALVSLGLALALSWAFWLDRRLGSYEEQLSVSRQARTLRDFAALWEPFFARDVQNFVVFGSPPFFASGKYGLFVRLYGPRNPDDPRSSPDFDEIAAKVGPLQGPRFDYASMGDAVAVQRLTAFFGSAGIPLRALPAHMAAWDSIMEGNLIFLGAWRMNPLLRRLPIHQDFELGPDDNVHNANPQPGEQQVYTTPSHRDSMTYAVVAAYPGLKPGREVLVVRTHSSPGAMGAADFITTPGSVTVMKERLGLAAGGRRKYFQMLLRIYVDNDLPVKTEYVTHHITP